MDDEFSKIQWLTSRFDLSKDRNDHASGVLIGVGDDGAVLEAGERATVVTVDAQVEGVHFRSNMLSYEALGRRAVIAAASDVWAMGARPSVAVIALTFPSAFEDSDFRAIIEGADAGARASGARIAGGNLSQAPALTITTTVLGELVEQPLSRSGAAVGDSIYVTGTLGSAGLGLAALESAGSKKTTADPFIDRWRKPPTHGDFVTRLADVATAAIDVSDGCLQDLAHLCDASSVGAVIRVGSLPYDEGYAETCRARGLDAARLALTAGEDYEILFCARPGASVPSSATAIGEITRGRGVRAIDDRGDTIEFDGMGYRHFS
ncbi:MAG: thiamine-phosphate kinase [Polyangiales bacterium]